MKHYGYPGHYCLSHKCRFHLCTSVCKGKYLVSTVGDLWVKDRDGELKRQAIGIDGFFETMVFRTGKNCDNPGCGCGMPLAVGDCLDMARYQTAGEAQAGHEKFCRKWTRWG